ncbi:ImmA/IrrE family metallo-endopeptidase [Sedimenticola selenatireducens]|uniref:ImmA/IrrE family metallo-endopeptidase n=1 Tax=Sedimenticola selenatireducens TaxID=191960 RepID=UPI002AABC2C7|nr:ImmA/IrrE family metallo-endopeptidase [Sedimenticola selenatireducens]
MAVMRRKNPRRVAPVRDISRCSSARELISLAKRHGLNDLPLDIDGLIRILNIRIRREALDDETSGYLKRMDGHWVIGVNNLHHPRRQRFTLAHELGHFVLHQKNGREFVDKILYRNMDSNPEEAEANAFAADLLMPEDEFRQFISRGSDQVEEIASRFNVSALAVRIRAKNLGFSGHGL